MTAYAMNNYLLSQLRDIHTPPTISIWPLALGWLALLILGSIATISIIYYYNKRRHKQQRRLDILQHIYELQKNITEDNYPLVYQELSTLLRRVALLTHERLQVANLTGDAWLDFLDKQCATKIFSQDLGRLLLTAPYFPRNNIVASPEPLLKLTEEWIKRCT